MANEKETINLKDALVPILNDIKEALLKVLDFFNKDSIKEDTIAEVYQIITNTSNQKLPAPVFNRQRMRWFWVEIDNFDGTNNVMVGINGDPSSGILIKAGKTKTLNYNNLKVSSIEYQAVSGTPAIQIICLRPRYQGK